MPIYSNNQETLIVPMCPHCALNMRYISGPMGAFWGCRRYPNCKYRLSVEEVGAMKLPPIEEEHPETFEEKSQRWIREMWGDVPEVISPNELPIMRNKIETGEIDYD